MVLDYDVSHSAYRKYPPPPLHYFVCVTVLQHCITFDVIRIFLVKINRNTLMMTEILAIKLNSVCFSVGLKTHHPHHEAWWWQQHAVSRLLCSRPWTACGGGI